MLSGADVAVALQAAPSFARRSAYDAQSGGGMTWQDDEERGGPGGERALWSP